VKITKRCRLALIAVLSLFAAIFAFGQDKPLESLNDLMLRANQGDANAACDLYANAQGTSHDYTEASRWWRKAAEQGNLDAQTCLANMYNSGHGVPLDKTEAAKWYRVAADQGYAPAQEMLGLMYHGGIGVPQDDKQAARWHRLAAEQGIAEAQLLTGINYQYGLGVPKDYKEAAKWYRMLAEGGVKASMNPITGRMMANKVQSAQCHLGYLYDTGGKGLAQDYTEAAKWYRLAADKGDATAQWSLGGMYQFGKGFPKDELEAVRWYRLAADQGLAFAQQAIGFMYEWGSGVPQDYVQAHMWYNLAGASGQIPDAMDYRERVARKMTSDQIAEAQRLAREWKPKTTP
jgi:TPR repeat protein